jgi:CRP/FNR family transcriptional regulator
VFLEGEIARGFYYLHAGWLKEVKISPEGREQTLQYLGPGEIFNYMGIFVGRPNPSTAIALEPAGVWLLQRATFHEVLATNPQLGVGVAEVLADYVVHLVQLVSDLSLHTVEARLAQRLLQQAEADVVYRQRWATQAEMAARLGTVPDVISRVLQKFAAEQLIRVERQRIWILDREGLAAKAILES